MKPKQAHIVLFLLDFLVFFTLWIIFDDFKNIIVAVNNGADVIEFQSRSGLVIVGFIVPIGHALILGDRLCPKLSKKYGRAANLGALISFFALFVVGIGLSIWLKVQVERAGYVYCFKASRMSVVSDHKVYTKDIDACESIARKKYK